MRRHVMPWRESTACSEQESFIRRWLKGEDTVSELCRAFGVSRKTGHKRINRYMGGAGRVSETAAGSP